MTKVSTIDGVVSLEHILEITEGQARAAKANPATINSVLKDLHIEHFISTTEDGVIMSKVGRIINDDCDLEKEIEALKDNHQTLINTIDTLNRGHEEMAVPASKEDFMSSLDSLLHRSNEEHVTFFAFAAKNGRSCYRGNIPSTTAAVVLREYTLHEYEKHCFG